MKTNWELWATTKHQISSWRFPLVSIHKHYTRMFHLKNCFFLPCFKEGYAAVGTFLRFWVDEKKIKEMSNVPSGSCLCLCCACNWFCEGCSVFPALKSGGGTHRTLDREQGLVRRRPQSPHLSQWAVLELLEQVSLLSIPTTLYSAFMCLSLLTTLCYFPSWRIVYNFSFLTTIRFPQYHKGSSYLRQTTLTASSLAQSTLTPHLNFHVLHLHTTLLPHPLLSLGPFYGLEGLPCELDCFQEYTHCFGREAGKWAINLLHLLSWEPFWKGTDPRGLILIWATEVCECVWESFRNVERLNMSNSSVSE